MKIVLIIIGVLLFIFISWPLGLLLLIIGLIIPSAREEEHASELEKLKLRIAELEIKTGSVEDRFELEGIKEYEASLTNEEKLMVKYYEAYL